MKTVCPKGRVGSNPTLSVTEQHIRIAYRKDLEKYPSWPKGLPWKGSRSLTAARGFKSLLLRSPSGDKKVDEKMKKIIDKQETT